MYGHGAPPPRSEATVITLRVLFTAVGVLCCGLLACVPLFRIAVLRGRVGDWALAWVSIPLSIACLSVIGALPETDPRTDVALAVVLLLGAASSAYFLTVDIRFHQQLRRHPGPAPFPPHVATTPASGYSAPYGYPQQPPSPYASAAVPPQPQARPQPQAPHTPAPRPPVPHPAPAPHDAAPSGPVPPAQRPAPARIDQVRAELDELSDYLRRQDGQHGQHGDHETGR
ncbi:hypothetical protein [Streptomyces viridosporus]|uniref:Integral membrane protein n=1 Tax=Streptomyces viridosporus T7A TaxID=665577 RepID=A0ABX6AFU3_STRVD|nr:hypothetical protein [Streptomyces viridosporus]QEU86161.1 hypothetical protein CP969_16675 [Streptomyces viridosporus T7A]